MKLAEIMELFQQKAPMETAESWDNSGLLVGSADADVHTAVVSLDITPEAIDCAVACGAELIVSHHPVIFSPLPALTTDSLPYRLAQAGIAALCLHTNLDKADGGVNDCLAARLGLQQVRCAPDGMSRIGDLSQVLEATAFAALVAERLQTVVRVRAGDAPIRTVAVCGGAGADLVLPLLEQVDAAVTGEVKHHEWLAVPSGKTLVDGGHFSTEAVVVERLAQWLRQAFPAMTVVIHRGEAPYFTVKD